MISNVLADLAAKPLPSALLRLGLRFCAAWWWIRRPITLGVQGIVLDAAGRVLLVRHTYRPGWQLPGGGVNRGESIQQALVRELAEEVGISCAVKNLELRGIYYHKCCGKHDHYCIFVVREWSGSPIGTKNFEIAESAFFPLTEIPEGAGRRTRESLAELNSR